MPKKQLTDAEKVVILSEALKKADRKIEELLAYFEIGSIARGAGKVKCSEAEQSTAMRVRKILRAALKRVEDKTKKAGQGPALGKSAAPRADKDRFSTSKEVKP